MTAVFLSLIPSRLVLALTVISVLTVSAANFYVSPTGSRSATGSIGSPWDLQTALNQPATVKPGDYIWLRGGIYSGGFQSNLNGNAANPIVVRNYNSERVTIDGKGNENALAIFGSYTWVWGLEITDSGTNRIVSVVGDVPASTGMTVYGPNIKCINLVVHDTNEGFSAYNQSPDSEYYGNLSYYNGFIAPDRPHGHGMYMQNMNGLKVLSDNIVGDNADEGLQIYGSGAATVQGFRIIGNTMYNTASISYGPYQYNLIIAGGNPRKDIQVLDNYSWLTPEAGAGSVTLGQYTQGLDMLVQNNVFVGGFIGVGIYSQSGPFTFTGNRLYLDPAQIQIMNFRPGASTTTGFRFDSNSYYGLGRWYANGININFPGWQSVVPDTNSSYAPGAPATNWVYVRPNKYEAKRANVTIFNWTLQSSVQVDLSGVLAPGDQYVVQDAQNFFGPPVVSGTYTGGSVAFPMSLNAKAQPNGFRAVPHTDPRFGVFVVLPVAAASGSPVDTTPPSVSFLALTNGQTVSGSVSVTASASDNVGVASVQFQVDGANLGAPVSLLPYTVTLNTASLTNGIHQLTAIASDAAGNHGTISISVSVNNAPVVSTPTTAQFVTTDTTTQGNWKTSYGGDGYHILGEATANYPSYATVTPNGQSYWLWTPSAPDPRDPQKSVGTDHVAAAWYADPSFTVDISITDGQLHKIAFYCLDWENAGRSQRIDILNADTGAQLDSRTLTSFANGAYLVWNVAGHVSVRFTRTGSKNSVVSAVLFGGALQTSAQFVKLDTTTLGNWKGAYGPSGYNVVGSTAFYPPSATLIPAGQSFWSWASSTTDPRALITSGAARTSATWYSGTSFTVDINPGDWQVHPMAIYCVDWENAGRKQTVEVIDADTGAVLDARNVSSFSNGQYLVWNIKGHIKLRFTNTGPKNAVVSGIFF